MLMFLTVWFHFRHLVWVESMDWCLNKRLELEEIQSGVELGYDTCCVPKVPFSTFFNTGRFQCWTWFLTRQYFQQHCCKNREETANKINLLSWADAPWMQTHHPSILNLQNVSTIIMLQLESQNHPNDSFFFGGGDSYTQKRWLNFFLTTRYSCIRGEHFHHIFSSFSCLATWLTALAFISVTQWVFRICCTQKQQSMSLVCDHSCSTYTTLSTKHLSASD